MGVCTGPWPSHLSETTCLPPGLTWHVSRLSTSVPWPTIMQPWPSAKTTVSVSLHMPVCAHRATVCSGSRPLCPLATAKGELSRQEHIFQPSTTREPQGPPLPQHPEERRKLGEASHTGPWAKQGMVPIATQQLTSLGWWELLRAGLLNWTAGDIDVDSSFVPCSTVWPGRTFLIWPTLSDPVVHSTS